MENCASIDQPIHRRWQQMGKDWRRRGDAYAEIEIAYQIFVSMYVAIEESLSPVSKSGNLRGQAYGKKIRKSPIPTIPQKLSWCDMTMSSHPIHKRFDLNWCWQSTMTKKGILPNKPFLSAFAWFHRGPFQLVDKQGWTCTSTCHR